MTDSFSRLQKCFEIFLHLRIDLIHVDELRLEVLDPALERVSLRDKVLARLEGLFKILSNQHPRRRVVFVCVKQIYDALVDPLYRRLKFCLIDVLVEVDERRCVRDSPGR